MFQQHQGESLSQAWTCFKDLLQKVPHYGIELWLQVQIFYDHVNLATRRTIDQSGGGKLRDKNAKESWALLEDLALYDNESWNDPRDFAKLVKVISLPQDVPSTSDRRLIELENQVQCLMEAHLALKSPVQVNKIIFSWLVSSFMASQDSRLSKFEADFKQQQGEMTHKIDTFLKAINDRMTRTLLSDTVKNPKLNVNSTSSVLSARSYPLEGPQCSSHIHNSINAIKLCSKQTNKSQKDQHQVKTLTVNENGEPPNKGIKSLSKLLSPKYQSQSSSGERDRNSSSPKRIHFINTITIISKENEPRETEIIKSDTMDNDHDTIIKVEELKDEEKEEKDDPEYIDTNLPSPHDPSISLITEKFRKLNSFLESLNFVPPSSNTQFICTKENDEDVMFVELIKKYDDSSEEELGVDGNVAIGEELGVEYFDRFPTRSELAYHKYLMYKAYIDLNSPINVMSRMQYNWIRRKQLEPREDPDSIRGISNFTRRIRGMHIFVGNFTYVSDFMIVEDISSIIDPRLSQVVLGKPFVEISNMTHDLSLGIVKFASGTDEITYKMPHKIDQFNSLSDLEKEHIKSVYFRNEEDKKKGSRLHNE
ncbi:hypothetical protein Tco_0954265 [Tanacetum coccineum]|uniref:MAK10-like protein n=1 Tax=Tanacetum coccineum TaxID=301880 RepID=A0ABQ5E277_9ASTR